MNRAYKEFYLTVAHLLIVLWTEHTTSFSYDYLKNVTVRKMIVLKKLSLKKNTILKKKIKKKKYLNGI
jgi:hypothetical protein